MKKFYQCAVLATFGFALLSSSAVQAQSPRGGVAIIDLSYIFKNHKRFDAMKDQLRTTVEAEEEKLKAERENIGKLAEQLKGFQPGTDNYKQLEEQLATRSAKLQADVNLRKKQFLEEEARMYFNVYREILAETKYFAQQQGYSLVLRFNGEEIDPSQVNPQEVLRGLNRAVVYSHPNIDITPHILRSLNQRAEGTPGTAGPGGQATRPGVPFPQQRRQ